MPDNDNGNNRDARYSNITLLFVTSRSQISACLQPKADRGHHLRLFEILQDQYSSYWKHKQTLTSWLLHTLQENNAMDSNGRVHRHSHKYKL